MIPILLRRKLRQSGLPKANPCPWNFPASLWELGARPLQLAWELTLPRMLLSLTPSQPRNRHLDPEAQNTALGCAAAGPGSEPRPAAPGGLPQPGSCYPPGSAPSTWDGVMEAPEVPQDPGVRYSAWGRGDGRRRGSAEAGRPSTLCRPPNKGGAPPASAFPHRGHPAAGWGEGEPSTQGPCPSKREGPA